MSMSDPFAGQGGRYERDLVTGVRRLVEPPTAPPAPIEDTPICTQAGLDAVAAAMAVDAASSVDNSPLRRQRRMTTEPTQEPTE